MKSGVRRRRCDVVNIVALCAQGSDGAFEGARARRGRVDDS